MENKNITINLNALPCTAVTVSKKSGHRLLCMDLDAAPAVGQWQDGMWHLALMAWERKEVGSRGDTHFLKPNPSRAERERMTEQEVRDLPIVGNMRPVPQQQRPKAEPLPQTDDPAFFEERDDDLPF
ncbi:MAG: hypothetical protein LUC33_00980 [Prevotellaceae bacterium]|nr:hypothetical protein [Prevotellaceae bacterium]